MNVYGKRKIETAKAAEQRKPTSVPAINLKKIIVESYPLDIVSNIWR